MLLIHILTFVSLAVASPLANINNVHRRAPVAQAPAVPAKAPGMWDNFTSGMSTMWSQAEHSLSDVASGLANGLSTVVSGMATMLGMGPMAHTDAPSISVSTTPGSQAPAPMSNMPSAPSTNDNDVWSSSGSGAGSGVSDSASDYSRVDSLSVVTASESDILCRRYPDEVISETRNAMMFMQPTNLDVKCWTTPSIQNYVAPSSSQRQQQTRLSTTWLYTTTGCYVNENNIANKTINFAQRLAYCAPPQHWVATLQPQYGRADCYQAPTLGAPSMNIDNGNHVDLSCFQDGETVQNNPMWYKVMDHGCYMPAGVFDDKKFLGQPGGRCGL